LRLRITPYDLQVQAASVPLAGSMVPHDHLSCFSTVLASTTELAQVTARFATDFRLLSGNSSWKAITTTPWANNSGSHFINLISFDSV
jgi:hypothetical protein